MGHYDDEYEATAREDKKRIEQTAKLEAKRLNTTVLIPNKFQLLGICKDCAGRVYSLPNWACNKVVCPHKP